MTEKEIAKSQKSCIRAAVKAMTRDSRKQLAREIWRQRKQKPLTF